MIGVSTIVMEGGCENKGDSELRDLSRKNGLKKNWNMKKNWNPQTHAGFHFNT